MAEKYLGSVAKSPEEIQARINKLKNTYPDHKFEARSSENNRYEIYCTDFVGASVPTFDRMVEIAQGQ